MKESLTPGTKVSLDDYIFTHISVEVLFIPLCPPSGEPFFKKRLNNQTRLAQTNYFEFAVKFSGSEMTSCIIYNC